MTDLLQPSPLIVAPPAGPAPEPELALIGDSSGITAAINPDGAELWWLRDAQEHDLLWQGDPAVWSGRSPILFPIVGQLAADTYRLDGEPHHLAKHGFARHARFTVTENGPNHVALRLEDDATTRAAYPFAFSLSLRFAVEGVRLSVSAEVANRGDNAMPFSFGFHPALRWPLLPGMPRGDHRILFEAPEAPEIRRMNAQGLLAQSEPSPLDGQVLMLRDSLFAQDAIIMPGVASHCLTYGASGGPALRVESENLPDLGIWTKPGAGFICIEPWQGYNDPEGFSQDMFSKPGIISIAPGDVWKAGMSITLLDHYPA